MKEINLIIFNYFFKNKILKKSFIIKKKDKLKEFNIYFKIANNNSVATISYNKNIIFWQTCKMFKGMNFKRYSLISLFSLCNALISFLNKIKNHTRINLYFSGLTKFRRSIVKLFLKNNFFIKNITELKFLSHNGVRTRKKRRLAKRRMRKIYQYSEFKKLKKAKKENFEVICKSINFFFLKKFSLKLTFFYIYIFLKLNIQKKFPV
jgi:ribosomal protein S11